MANRSLVNLLLTAALTALLSSCVLSDKTTGNDFIPDEHLLRVKQATLYPEFVNNNPDSVQSISYNSMIFGSLTNEGYGTLNIGSVGIILPSSDTMDLGIDPQLNDAFLHVKVDSTLFLDPSQEGIAQNVYLLRLNTELDSVKIYNNSITLADFDPTPVSKGAPVYFGGDSLRIYLTDEFAKELMVKYDVPTAGYQSFSDYKAALEYVSSRPLPAVLKYDGLAAGKGVVIAETLEEADAALKSMLCDSTFGQGKVVVEDFLTGPEFSFMCFVDGENVYPMPLAQDHKRAYDGDKGPNTGGMGAVSPVPFANDEFMKKGILLIVDGTDPEFVRKILETELECIEDRHKSVITFWENLASMGPAWGMIGTLIGLVLMLTDLQDINSVGPNMAVALITTFYGSLLANWICLPMAAKLKEKSSAESMIKVIVVEGLLSIQAGENPRVIEEKLKSFVDPTAREALSSGGGED